MASGFPFDLLGVVLGPTMLEVTSEYSVSENNFFLRDRRLLEEFDFETFGNEQKTDDLVIWKLQWQSESGTEERFDEHSSFSLSSPSDLLQGYLKN